MPYLGPDKEYGTHAGYDAEGRELIYIGWRDLKMNRDLIKQIDDAFFATFFGKPPPTQ